MNTTHESRSIREKDVKLKFRRWVIVPMLILIYSFLHTDWPRYLLYVPLYFMFLWLIAHPFRPSIARYTRAFEAHSQVMFWAFVLIFLTIANLILIETGYVISHWPMHFSDLSPPARIGFDILGYAFIIVGTEFIRFEHSRPSNQTHSDAT